MSIIQQQPPLKIEGNPNSIFLSVIFGKLYNDLDILYHHGKRLGSSHITNLVRMIEQVLKQASSENPLPVDINFDKIKKCIENEESSVVYDHKDTVVIYALLDEMTIILGKESKRISTGKSFERGAFGFCQTAISMFRDTDVKNFQNSKVELVSGFKTFFSDFEKEYAQSETFASN